jgi:hypothetical protein
MLRRRQIVPAKLTPQQQEIIRKMREMDEAARRAPERTNPYDRSRLWAMVAVIVMLVLICVALLVLRGCATSPMYINFYGAGPPSAEVLVRSGGPSGSRASSASFTMRAATSIFLTLAICKTMRGCTGV